MPAEERKKLLHKLMYADTRRDSRKMARLRARHPDWDEERLAEEMTKPQKVGRPSRAEMAERKRRAEARTKVEELSKAEEPAEERPKTPPIEPEIVDRLARALLRLIVQ